MAMFVFLYEKSIALNLIIELFRLDTKLNYNSKFSFPAWEKINIAPNLII